VLISDTRKGVSLRTRSKRTAGGTSDLESLKSGKDKDKTLVCTQLNETNVGFSPRAEPPTSRETARPNRFRDDYSSAFSLALLAYSSST
jgi:hypothetical protein